MSQRNKLRSRDIEKVDDVVDALDLCERFGVPCDDLDDVEEFKSRLWMHYNTLKQGNVKHRIQDAMQRTSQENDKKRLHLVEMFEKLMRVIGTCDNTRNVGFIRNLLQKDLLSGDIIAEVEANIESLKEKECVILVAGETAAGKSSFLNLLLGSELLPTSACICITTLRYGKQKEARIIYGDPKSKVDVIENLDKDGMEKLYNITFMKGKERFGGHDVKEVQVYLPLEFLKCGIVLADTPGIGENEFLEQYLMDFISNNQILGFIYIIFSDSPVGVQEDRLLLLLKMIIEQQKNNKALKFNPKAALFLANRFDAVPKSSREKVKTHILSQLGKYWPEFDESMTVFFSTKTALRDIAAHPDYVNDDYKKLLTSLGNLFSLAIDRRIRVSYKWIETVFRRLNHYLKATVAKLDISQRNDQEESAKQQYKLQNLKEQSNTVIRELFTDIEERSKDIVREVQKYLSSPQAKFLLCSVWNENEIPKLDERNSDINHWLWVKERIDNAFYDRLCNEIEDWDEERCKVSSIEEKIVENIKLKLGVLQEDISTIEREMRYTNASYGFERLQMIDEPMKLSSHVQHRVVKIPIEKIKQRIEKRKFEEDPKAWARGRAEQLMKCLLENKQKGKSEVGVLTRLVDQLMQRPRDIVDKLEQQIPRIIDTNMELLESMQDMIVSKRRDTHIYEETMVLVEGLKQSLMNYGEGYIFVDDFKLNELKVLKETPTGQSLAQTFRFSELVTGKSSTSPEGKVMASDPHGLWTIVRPGKLERDSEAKPVSIKMYMPSSGVGNTFKEVAKLRYLLHKDVNLAEFLGIHHTEAVTPAYIFDGHLQSLHQYITEIAGPKKDLPRLLREIAEGVHYLHSKGIVHMELKSSTITVAESGKVCLTGACIPRHASFPIETEIPVSDFIYLAPEVLGKHIYNTPADVYGYGLLMYELLSEKEAFEDQRNSTFKDFVERINLEKMPTLVSSLFSEGTMELVSQCLQISAENRPTMSIVIEKLSSIKSNFKSGRLPVMQTPWHVFRKTKKK